MPVAAGVEHLLGAGNRREKRAAIFGYGPGAGTVEHEPGERRIVAPRSFCRFRQRFAGDRIAWPFHIAGHGARRNDPVIAGLILTGFEADLDTILQICPIGRGIVHLRRKPAFPTGDECLRRKLVCVRETVVEEWRKRERIAQFGKRDALADHLVDPGEEARRLPIDRRLIADLDPVARLQRGHLITADAVHHQDACVDLAVSRAVNGILARPFVERRRLVASQMDLDAEEKIVETAVARGGRKVAGAGAKVGKLRPRAHLALRTVGKDGIEPL